MTSIGSNDQRERKKRQGFSAVFYSRACRQQQIESVQFQERQKVSCTLPG